MYKEYSAKGEVLDIGFDGHSFPVHLPKQGYVYNFFTGKMEQRQAINWNVRNKEKQLWSRTELPKEWRKWRRLEIKRQESDPSYVHPEAQKFREQEWDRRINGVWFKWMGKYVYLTGLHYFHLNYMKFSFGYPAFREIDLVVFYALQCAIEDPNSHGLIFATRRRFGKTAILFTFLMEYITRAGTSRSGFQHNSDDDAKDVWDEYVPYAFDHLPDFFKPIYDTNSKMGSNIWFREARTSGTKKEESYEDYLDDDLKSPALSSLFDFKKAAETAYDGKKLQRYGNEEPGKFFQGNIKERYKVVRKCLMDGHRIIGKCFLPTTIEESKGESLEYFVDLFEQSFYDIRPSNNRTESGMYNLFIPAYKSYMIDLVTGKNDEVESKRILDAERAEAEKKGDLSDIASLKRKDPYTWKEAKMRGVEDGTFPALILNERLTAIEIMDKKPYRIGNFQYVDNKKDGPVEFVETNYGRWAVSYLPGSGKNNLVNTYETYYRGEMMKIHEPMGEIYSVGGCDPVDTGKNVVYKNKASMAASHVYLKPLPQDIHSEEWVGDNFVCQYLSRRDNPIDFYEDMIMQCRFWGSQIHVEANKGKALAQHFERRGYGAFLAWRPKSTFTMKGNKQASPMTPNSETITRMYVERLQVWLNKNGHRVPFESLIKQFLDYNPKHARFYDLVVSAGYTLLATELTPQYSGMQEDLPSIQDLFPKSKMKC